MVFDILVIGSGPAGVTAGIYAARAKKKVLVIEKEAFGGLITHSPKIENYPGFETVSGIELAEKFITHAESLGVDFEFDKIEGITKVGDNFVLKGEMGEYEGKTVIIATGSKHRKLGLEKEDEFVGHGISYCAVCDGPFYAGCNVVIVGGGNSALQEAVLLSGYCNSVTMVQNLGFLTGEKSLAVQIDKTPNINVLYNKHVVELTGDKKIQSIVIEDTESHEKQIIPTDAVFVAIGQEADNLAFKDICDLDNAGFIVTDELCGVNNPGIFVAGDCRKKKIRQISTAIADGTIAAVQAISYLENKN